MHMAATVLSYTTEPSLFSVIKRSVHGHKKLKIVDMNIALFDALLEIFTASNLLQSHESLSA